MQCNSVHVSPSPNKKHKEVPKLSITPDPYSRACTFTSPSSFFSQFHNKYRFLFDQNVPTKYHLVCCFTSIFLR